MAVGVEGIYAVVLNSNKQHIVLTLAGYVQPCKKERSNTILSFLPRIEALVGSACRNRAQGGTLHPMAFHIKPSPQTDDLRVRVWVPRSSWPVQIQSLEKP
jgi:hypothetical protein